MIKASSILLLLGLMPVVVLAQFKYPHRYFSPRDYQSDREVLCMDQSDDGTMYIGTGASLLRYDGEVWKESEIPGKKVIYWLKVQDSSGRIYVGSSGEFGYFDFELNYYSLSDRLGDETSDFGAIWEVDLSSHGVYFRSSKYIFRYYQDQLSRIDGLGPEESPFDIIFTVNDTIFTRIRDVGLATIYDGRLEVVVEAERFSYKSNAFIPHPDGMLIATRSNGLFLYKDQDVSAWEVEVSDYLKENRVYHAAALSNGYFAFATLTGGVLIMDQDGRLHHLIKSDNYGIYEGTGYVFEDNKSGLWIGTKRGMAYVDIASRIRYFQMEEITENTTFEFFEGQFYFGSVNGMYLLEGGSVRPRKVLGFPNLVTRIFEYDGMLLATDLTSFFEIDELQAKEIFSPPITCLTSTTSSPHSYAAGDQEGLVFLTKNPDWELILEDEDEVKNVNDLLEYEGTLWGISSSGGLFKYGVDETRFYDLRGSRSLGTFKGKLVVTAQDGFFTYDASTDQFEAFQSLNKFLPKAFLKVEDFYTEADSTWVLYFNKEKVLTGDIFLGDSLVRELPLFDARVEENVAIELNKGILTISNGVDIFQYDGVRNKESISKGGVAIISSNQFSGLSEIKYSQNKLRFDFTVKSTFANGNNYYRYRIDGYSDDWSRWSTQNYMEITNLLEGEYQLQLEARTPDRSIATASFDFSISPPWYRTNWAYFCYIICSGILIWGFVKWRSRYLEDERKNLERLVSARTSEIIAQKATIEQSLKDREVLLREIHHRVKNNLQVISSIFNMQLKEAKTEELRKLINDGQSRMKTMSLIHQKLYQSERLDAIELEDYTMGLITQINQLYNKGGSSIEHVVNAKGIQLNIDTAIPVGLILNELLSNTYKYAFDNGSGQITINITGTGDGTYLLKYCDNGKGLPEHFNLEKNDSLGLRLVSILARQLKGDLEFTNGNGVCYRIEFKAVDA